LREERDLLFPKQNMGVEGSLHSEALNFS